MQGQSIVDFHMPGPLLAKIVSCIAEDGVDALKNQITSGPEGKEAVFSNETLATVRLDKSEHLIWWTMPHSKYYSFFCKCLAQGNPYAKFADMNKGVAFQILVTQCFQRGQWDPSYMLPNGPWRMRKHWRMDRPRCARCRRPGHTFSNYQETFYQRRQLFSPLGLSFNLCIALLSLIYVFLLKFTTYLCLSMSRMSHYQICLTKLNDLILYELIRYYYSTYTNIYQYLSIYSS